MREAPSKSLDETRPARVGVFMGNIWAIKDTVSQTPGYMAVHWHRTKANTINRGAEEISRVA